MRALIQLLWRVLRRYEYPGKACGIHSWTSQCAMLRIARELSESDSGVFAILEDACCEDNDKAQRRDIGLQTEISCNDAPLATDVSIRPDHQHSSCESRDTLFWRAVATQRASELDAIRDDITKMRELITKNVNEKQALDKKHDELYCQLQEIVTNNPDDDCKF